MTGFLADTHLLLWAVLEPERLSRRAAGLISDRSIAVSFSLASLWEVAVKTSLRKPGFNVDPTALRDTLLHEGLSELAIEPSHIARVASLPPLHGDSFDRMLAAQAMVEGLNLLTADKALKAYGRCVRAV